jgi:hypothetical protein
VIPRLISAYLLGVVVIAAFFTWGQGGQTPKEVSPEIVKKMEREARGPVPYDAQGTDNLILRAIAVLTQHVVDLEKRIDVHRAEIDSMEPAKSGDRLLRLEMFVSDYRHSQELQESASKARWEALMSWFRIIGTGIIGLALNEVWKRHKDKLRRFLRDQKTDAKLDKISKNTDGMTERLETYARKEGFDAAKAEDK